MNLFRADIHKLRWSQLIITVLFVGVMVDSHFNGFASLKWWGLSLGMFFLSGCTGVTATFHRKLSHNSYETPKWLEYVHTFFGCVGGTSSSIAWVGMHKKHHENPDTEQDPHAPSNGTWSVLTSGYIMHGDYKWAVRELVQDRFHLFFHQYYYAILTVWAAALYFVHPLALIYGFIVPCFVQVWASTLTNWADHQFGYRNYDTPDESTNAWWSMFFNWGEAWHNNHHAHPRHWSFRHKWWEVDFTAMYIWLLMTIGLARVPADMQGIYDKTKASATS